MRMTVLSQRMQTWPHRAWDPVFDFEDLAVRHAGGQLACVRGKTGLARVLAHGPLRLRRGPLRERVAAYRPPEEDTGSADFLLAVVLTPMGLEHLQSVPGWREKAGKVAVYVIDSYHHGWYRHFARTLGRVDRIFVTIEEDVEPVARMTGVPVTLLPWGFDVVAHGWGLPERRIGLMAMGRQPPEHVLAIARRLNTRGSGRFAFHGRVDVAHGESHAESRALMYHMLRLSRLSLCYCPSFWCERGQTPPFVTPRWLESLAAGAIPVGKRPGTPLADAMFDWEDALIDLPEDPEEAADSVVALLEQEERLNRAHARNYRNMLERHDWRHRLREMLDVMGFDGAAITDEARAELGQLLGEVPTGT